MHILLYFTIFISKVIENSLATLRLIVVANGKKLMGAVLQFCIALVWVVVTGMVVVDITKDPLKILFFALGSFVGSYIGSLIEQKLAMGDSMLIGITKQDNEDILVKAIREDGYHVTLLEGKEKEQNSSVLMILVPRKERNKIAHMIKNLDRHSMIVSEKVASIHDGNKTPLR